MASSDPYNLERFLDAQQGTYDLALVELRGGAKQSHWMWFIFPQLTELGQSATAKFYGIGSLDEAGAYLEQPVLGFRLRECVTIAGSWARRRSAEQIFGPIDAMKLRSSLTLFDRVEPGAVFAEALAGLFSDNPDELTLALLNAGR